MTLLVSWIGVDPHGPTSAYIVSDSRISWDGKDYFDYGRKVFASRAYPELFGYAGDVLFPSIVLAQLVEMIDSNILFSLSMSCEEKNKIIYEKLRYSFNKYPNQFVNNPIQIIHITRDTDFKGYPKFYIFEMTWSKAKGWHKKRLSIPAVSGLLLSLGSGAEEFKHNYYSLYQNGINSNTSRNVFHCFIDTLNGTKDKFCGGAPQLVGMYRKTLTPAINYGIIQKRKRYYLGMEIPSKSVFDNIEWRNELFELCNGNTRKRLDGATPQPDPLHH